MVENETRQEQTSAGGGEPEMTVRLAKAQEFIGRGKQRQALQELWYAEARARGNAEAIREMLEFTRALEERVEPRQKSRLVELVAALEHDARHATGPDVTAALPPPYAEPTSGRAFYLGLVFSLLLAAGLGALILLFWAFHLSNPCPCSGDFCIFGDPAIGGADAHLNTGGVGLGMSLGGVGLLIVSGFLVSRFRTRLALPLLWLIVGFPVLYGVFLLSIWGVARGVWGPTKC